MSELLREVDQDKMGAALIPLQVNPVQAPQNPVQTFGQLMNIRDVGSQIALRQAQTEHAVQQAAEQQTIADQRRRDLNDQNTIQQAMGDPNQGKAIGAGDLSSLNGKITPTALFNLTKTITDAHKDAAALQGTDLANNKARHDQFEQTLNGLMQLNPADRPAAYQNAVASLSAAGLLKGINLPPTIDTSDDGLNRLAASNSVLQGVYETAQKMKAEQEKINLTRQQAAQAQAEAALKTAGVPGTTAEGQIKTTQAANMTPSGLLPEEKIRADQAAAELARQNAAMAETQRHNQADERLSGGRLGIEAAKNARDQKIYEQTYGEGANPALVGVDPKLRTQAAAAAQKAAVEHITATSAAEEMKSIIDLAKGGNKVAYSYAPVTGVLTINSANGTKRMNMAEIKQYEGAGNLPDKLSGFFGKQISGASIPDNILNDMGQLHSSLATTADHAYNDKVSAINQTYRSNFQPVTPASPKATTGGEIRARDPEGKLHKAPAGTALPAGWKLEQ